MSAWWEFPSERSTCENKQHMLVLNMNTRTLSIVYVGQKYYTVTALFMQLEFSLSLSLILWCSPPHSSSLTATLQIHNLWDLQTILALSHSPHTHITAACVDTHTHFPPPHCCHPCVIGCLLLSYRPPPCFFWGFFFLPSPVPWQIPIILLEHFVFAFDSLLLAVLCSCLHLWVYLLSCLLPTNSHLVFAFLNSSIWSVQQNKV